MNYRLDHEGVTMPENLKISSDFANQRASKLSHFFSK